MFITNLTKITTIKLSIFTGLTLSTLAVASTAQAAIIGDFEDPSFPGWMTTGDVSQQGTFQGVDPTEGNYQILLGTGSKTLQDDAPQPIGTFNFSGNNPTQAGGALESFLGLNIGDLDPNSPFLQAIEGSAIKFNFTAQEGEQVSFDWTLLYNDGELDSPFNFGPRDTAYVALYSVGNPTAPTLLTSSIGTPDVSNPTFANRNNGSFTSDALNAGDYLLGIAVVDGQGTDKTSALLVDNVVVDTPTAVPVPEPANILSSFVALGMGAALKKKYNREHGSIGKQ